MEELINKYKADIASMDAKLLSPEWDDSSMAEWIELTGSVKKLKSVLNDLESLSTKKKLPNSWGVYSDNTQDFEDIVCKFMNNNDPKAIKGLIFWHGAYRGIYGLTKSGKYGISNFVDDFGEIIKLEEFAKRISL